MLGSVVPRRPPPAGAERRSGGWRLQPPARSSVALRGESALCPRAGERCEEGWAPTGAGGGRWAGPAPSPLRGRRGRRRGDGTGRGEGESEPPAGGSVVHGALEEAGRPADGRRVPRAWGWRLRTACIAPAVPSRCPCVWLLCLSVSSTDGFMLSFTLL